MRLAALITVYNGLELLQKCVENLERQVDGVIICYQNVSNKGSFSPHVGAFCRSMGVDTVKFTPDLTIKTKENERLKHDFMLQYSKKHGFSHAILMATDHFYTDEQVYFSRKDVAANDWDVTATSMQTYYKRPTWRVDPMEDYYMPFIIALRPETRCERVAGFPFFTDPSVQVNTCQRSRMYAPDEVLLHHYSMIRVDIAEKFRNAAASIRWNPEQVSTFISEFEDANLGDPITYFKGRKLVEAEDFFGLT
jgi:hypothetical protein